MLDSELAKMLSQTAYVARVLAVSQTGDRVYGDPQPIKVREEPDVRLVDTTPTGDEVFSSYRWFTLTPVGLQDHVWLVGADPRNPQLARMPKSVTTLTDENGSVSHYQVGI